MDTTLKTFKHILLFSLIYPQINCVMLAEWVLLDVRGSAGAILEMRSGGLCVMVHPHRVDVNEGQMR